MTRLCLPFCFLGWISLIVLLSVCTPARSMTTKERIKLREEVRSMFYHLYTNYMENAFPMDELKPLSCTGRGREGRGSLDDILGGFSLTLIDTLDTLVVLGDFEEFEKALRLVINNVTFNHYVTVSVFETTIRVLGGLLSAHLMALEHSTKLVRGYNGELLHMAIELGDRMLPAFNTPTGIPYSRVNLMMGIPRGESPETCTAGAGTLLLEFGLLSRLSGKPVYMDVARKAVIELWRRRSNLSLVGNIINVLTGQWIRVDTSIGAGIDSYFEYLLKGYILFGDQELYDIFVQAYNSVEKYEKKGQWYVSVHMTTGQVVREWVENLQMFWPGLQVMMGHIESAIENFNSFYQLWKRYGLPPEAYSIPSRIPVPGVSGYPLRPEMIESAYMLYLATHDNFYLHAGKQMMYNINNYTRVQCGFAAVSDVVTKKLEDRVDSFFLSETCKYLYLLFDPEPSPYYKDVVSLQPLASSKCHLVPVSYEYHLPSRTSLHVPPTTQEIAPICKNPEPPPGTPMFPVTRAPHTPRVKTNKTVATTPKSDPNTQLTMHIHIQPLDLMNPNPQAQQFMDQDFPPAVIEANLPSIGETKFLAIPANFGPALTSNPIVGRLIYATPADGCTPLFHPSRMHVRNVPYKTILLMDRGICMFGEKVRIAMDIGVHGVIVVDNAEEQSVFLMTDGLSDSHPRVTIPSVLVNKSMGEQLKLALFENVSENFMVTMRAAYLDEEFAESAQFYQDSAGGVTLNLDLGKDEWTQEELAEAVLKQLQQMIILKKMSSQQQYLFLDKGKDVKLDGQFQLQFLNSNNQPITLTIGPAPSPPPALEDIESEDQVENECVDGECKGEYTEQNNEKKEEQGSEESMKFEMLKNPSKTLGNTPKKKP